MSENFNNDEDEKIWNILESFDFSKNKNHSSLRKILYNKIIREIGICNDCSSFINKDNTCSLLKIKTGSTDRCCDFERRETEELTAFDVMSEQFTEGQKLRETLAKNAKYSHWKQGYMPSDSRDSNDEPPPSPEPE
jgi:hypothetical protein